MAIACDDAFCVDPEWANICFGAVQPMRMEFPNFHDALRLIDQRGGVARVWFFPAMPAYVLTRYDDVRAAFLDTGTFSPRATQELLTFPLLGPTFLGYEGREHDVHRRVVQPQFSKRCTANNVAPLLRPQAHAVIDEFCADSEANLLSQFAKRFPLAIVGGMLGLPVEDWDRMGRWANDLILGGDPDDSGESPQQIQARRQRSAQEFREWLHPLIIGRRGSDNQDVLTRLANGVVDGEALTDDQIMSFMLLLFPAGVDTTWLGVGNMMAAVLSTPGAAERLRDDAESRYWAVEETLRWAPPVSLLPRVTARDADIRGVRIPAGSLTLLAIASANRDATRFPDPDRWDLDRRSTQHLTFSVGEHFCLGSHLARAEMLTALEVLLDRLPGVRLTEQPRYWGASIRGPEAVHVAFQPSAPRSGAAK